MLRICHCAACIIIKEIVLHWSVGGLSGCWSSSRRNKRFLGIARINIIPSLSFKGLSLSLLTTGIRVRLIEGALSCQVDIAMVRDRPSVT